MSRKSVVVTGSGEGVILPLRRGLGTAGVAGKGKPQLRETWLAELPLGEGAAHNGGCHHFLTEWLRRESQHLP